MSRHEPGQQAYILFGDRTPASAITLPADTTLAPGQAADFDTPHGLRALTRTLTAYNVALLQPYPVAAALPHPLDAAFLRA